MTNLANENKILRIAASAWLIQNSFLIATSVWKNIAYVAAYGLTYKRIGVFLFLSIVLTGLYTTINKIKRQYSLWRYVKSNFQIGFATFAIAGLVNWDGIISDINTSSSIQADVDISYLLRLDNPDVEWLNNYFQNHPEKLPNYKYTISDKLEEDFFREQTSSWKSWPNRTIQYQRFYEDWLHTAHLAQIDQVRPKSKNTDGLPTKPPISESKAEEIALNSSLLMTSDIIESPKEPSNADPVK